MTVLKEAAGYLQVGYKQYNFMAIEICTYDCEHVFNLSFNT